MKGKFLNDLDMDKWEVDRALLWDVGRHPDKAFQETQQKGSEN